ncbi:uncharacterized protein LOC144642063 [Oculina patagonica]
MAFMLLKPVFKATVSLLISKGRTLAAEKLKDGDVADEKFRKLIVREMDDIKSKLDGLAGKDLAASISFLKDGVVYLGKVLDVETAGKEGSDTVSTQTEGAVGGIEREEKTVLLAAKEMKNLQLTDLNEATRKNLSEAKERFKDARRKAVEAFGNSALSTSDRLLAMAIRIVATLLEQVEDLANALASCRLCLEELHSLSVVQENFSVELKKGIKSKFGKDERNKIIVAVCQMNRVIYDVIQMVDEGASKARELLTWPCVDVGDERIDLLRDSRIAQKLRKLGMEQFCVQAWSFGQEGEEEPRLKYMTGIAINTKGQFIIADIGVVKRFDSSGKFLNSFSPVHDTWIADVATDRDDNMYVLSTRGDSRGAVQVFDTQAKLHHSFLIRPGYDVFSLVVDDSSNVLVSVSDQGSYLYYFEGDDSDDGRRESRLIMVEVYENHGRLLHTIEVMCLIPSACHISTTGDGRVMVLDRVSHTLHLFSASEGYPLEKKVQLRKALPEDRPFAMTFHQESEQLIIASFNEETKIFRVSLYNKDGEFVRSIPLHIQTESADICDTKGIVVTNNGRIALALEVVNFMECVQMFCLIFIV